MVLVAPRCIRRRDDCDRRISAALDVIARLGWTLIGLVDVADYRVAHKMVADGEADVIMAAAQEDLASVVYAADAAPNPNQHIRTRRLLRPVDDLVSPRDRRTCSSHRSRSPRAASIRASRARP